jgi:hypothetical protein
MMIDLRLFLLFLALSLAISTSTAQVTWPSEIPMTTPEVDSANWEQMMTQLNKIIILKQQANMKEREEKIRLYDRMTMALEKSMRNCETWKAIAMEKRRRANGEDILAM